MAKISLWLDSYDDIYSDFDSRQYGKRRVSEDFLNEMRQALRGRESRVRDLVLVIPPELRADSIEQVIETSLKEKFSEQYHLNQARCARKLRQGVLLGLAGVVVMTINSVIGFQGIYSLPLTALRVVLEPGGWFLVWASLDFLFYDWKELKKEREFFRLLTEITVHFKSA